MITLSQETIFYHYLRNHPVFLKYINSNFFKNNKISKLIKIEKSFFKKYKNIAKPEQLKSLLLKNKEPDFFIESENKELIFNDNLFNSLFKETDLNEYDIKWLDENFKAWVEWKNLEHSIFDVVSLLKIEQVTTDNIKRIVSDVKTIINDKNNILFDENLGTDIDDPDEYYIETKDTFSTGYRWIDEKLGGGLSYKTLTVFFGAAKAGKSLVLGNLANNISNNGYNVALITLELSEKKYLKRLASNMLNIPIVEYDDKIKDKPYLKDLLSRRNELNGMTFKIPGKLFIKEFPASSISVRDIESYMKKLEETTKIKFDVIILDYLNLLVDDKKTSSDNTYLKIKNIAESIRALAMTKEYAIISATQANREGLDRKGVLGMSSVSESVGLPQTVDALFSLTRDELESNVLTIGATALRDSDGMGESCEFDIDGDYMRLTQKDNEDFVTTKVSTEIDNSVANIFKF